MSIHFLLGFFIFFLFISQKPKLHFLKKKQKKRIHENPHPILHFGDSILREPGNRVIGGLNRLIKLLGWRLHWWRQRNHNLLRRIEDWLLNGRLGSGWWGHEHRVWPNFSDHRRRRWVKCRKDWRVKCEEREKRKSKERIKLKSEGYLVFLITQISK